MAVNRRPSKLNNTSGPTWCHSGEMADAPNAALAALHPSLGGPRTRAVANTIVFWLLREHGRYYKVWGILGGRCVGRHDKR
jgi:hypothetical protein